ncbi:MAG: type II secretion system F family protein [Isosphaeraceae bacterium]
MIPAPEFSAAVPSAMIAAALALAPEPLLGLWDELAIRHVRDCVALARTVRIDEPTIRRAMRLWGVALVAVPLWVGWVFGTPIFDVVALPLVFQSPRWILNAWINRRRRKLRDQLVPVCYGLANTARANLSLSQGLGLMARESPEPIRGELRRIVHEYESGRTLSKALQDASDRLGLESFWMFTSALLCCIENGGPLTDTLDQIAETIQENQRLQSRMEVQTASGRLTITALGIFPVIFLTATYLVDPNLAANAFALWQGQAALLVALILIVWAVRSGLKIVRFQASA